MSVMNDLAGRETPELLRELMLQALRVPDGFLNRLAAELLGRFGERPVRGLVLEAVSRKNTPAHRLRVLQVLLHVGRLSGEDVMDLSVLLCDRNPRLRRTARLLLGRLPAGATDAAPP